MTADNAPDVLCHITTKGAPLTRRVESLMEKLRFAFAVSLDGATKKTEESIRVGENFEEQMAILKVLREYANEKKTDLSPTFRLMAANWREFGGFCLLAHDWGCNVGISTVTQPVESSINALPVVELRKVVDAMEALAPSLDTRLKRNRAVRFREPERLQRMCGTLQAASA